jgi:hypothetical protein
MARADQAMAKDTYNQAKTVGNTAAQNAKDLYGQIVPTYQNMVTNPQGYGKAALADFTTGAEQSLGGGVGAAVGQAGTNAAANRNLGSFAPAITRAVRDAGKTLGGLTLGVKDKNAQLKELQRTEGLEGLGRLQGQQQGMVLPSIGLRNQSIGTDIEAGKSGWFQNMIQLINALKPGGKGGGGGGGGDYSGAGSPGGMTDEEWAAMQGMTA